MSEFIKRLARAIGNSRNQLEFEMNLKKECIKVCFYDEVPGVEIIYKISRERVTINNKFEFEEIITFNSLYETISYIFRNNLDNRTDIWVDELDKKTGRCLAHLDAKYFTEDKFSLI